jgi:hypothetical protein
VKSINGLIKRWISKREILSFSFWISFSWYCF